MRKRNLTCKKCHVSGAEEPDEIIVTRVYESPYDGARRVTLHCEKCGHEWETEFLNGLDKLPGYNRAVAEMNARTFIKSTGKYSRYQ